ncbi:MAG: sugar ABC transporter substrate-binding protein [Spirochaetaceae bacterium]|nr:sugar ABC transporter substrate-binding protein [Spirochaetaceae bacterium]
MSTRMSMLVLVLVAVVGFVFAAGEPEAESDFSYDQVVSYGDPVPIQKQASFGSLAYEVGSAPVVAYMPPATEFNYYMAIGAGIEALAEELGVEFFMLAPQSGADINGQMGMLQDVITRGVDAIILSTHDEFAAAPLVEQAVSQGIEVVIVNSDITDFPTPIHGVVGYSQRKGTHKIGEYLLDLLAGEPVKVGIVEGQPGYHSTERVGGFIDAVESAGNVEIVYSIDGKWNVEGGNTAAMDMLQAKPDIDVVFAANDYMIMGVQRATDALYMDLILLGNDGDTAALEEIAAGTVTATVNTTPFDMGRIALQTVLDGLHGEFEGGYVETPTDIVDQDNAVEYLSQPDMLFPQPSRSY